MCGRYALTTPPETLVALFRLAGSPELRARWNVAPSQLVPIVREPAPGRREMVLVRWGLVPAWATDPAIGSRMINARAETAGEKPGFRDAMERRRCIVPASWFYEWKSLAAGGKQPYKIARRDGRPLALAALWERWSPAAAAQGSLPGLGPEAMETCAILTTDPAGPVAELHDRMPLALRESDIDAWLDPRCGADDALVVAALRGAPADDLVATPVSARVNSVRNDDAASAAPADSGGV